VESEIRNIFSVDLEDWFFTGDYPVDSAKLKYYEQNLIINTRIILKLLNESKNTATFFVLGKIAESLPDLINEIHCSGHEIATHGYSHKKIYTMTEEEFNEDLDKTISAITKVTKIKPFGYRSPYFQIQPWIFKVLNKFGVKYDSSMNIRGMGGESYRQDIYLSANTQNIIEFELENYNLFGVSIPINGGGYFRAYPYAIFKKLFTKCINKYNMRIFYIHPWDLGNSLDKKFDNNINRFKNFYNSSSSLNKLEKLMEDYNFDSFRKFLEEK